MPADPIPLIGLVGGIASGKSYVSEQFERRGAAVISADQLAHEVIRLPEIKSRIRERFGSAVFGADGEVDRGSLAKIVFAPPPAGPAELKALEQITHPRIGQLAREKVGQWKQEGNCTAILLDVPLLLETGWNKFCDKVVFIDVPFEMRLSRVRQRGWSEEDLRRREAAQLPLAAKREAADFILDNAGTPEALAAQIDQLWPVLLRPST